MAAKSITGIAAMVLLGALALPVLAQQDNGPGPGGQDQGGPGGGGPGFDGAVAAHPLP